MIMRPPVLAMVPSSVRSLDRDPLLKVLRARPGHANLRRKSCGIQAVWRHTCEQGKEEASGAGQVLRTDALSGERPVAQVVLEWCGQWWKDTRQRERTRRGGRVQGVHPTEDAQNRPESEFCRAFHRSSILGSSPINQLD